jgi:protein-tyrosine-phosphatase
VPEIESAEEEFYGLRLPTAAKSVLRNLVPEYLLKQRDIVKRLGPAGRTYASFRLLDAVGVRASRLVPSSSRSFLFVCYGNIMRSPMAEALMKQELSKAGLERQIEVVSAGLHAVPDRQAHPWALEASGEMGISLIDHRARQLTEEMMAKADCIFAMDFQNKAELLTLYPKARRKIYMLSAYAEGRARNREIPDPYLGDLEMTRSCYRDLQTCIRNLMVSRFFTAANEQNPAALLRS